DLRASGVSGEMQLQARYERDGLVATVRPSEVTIDDQVLTLEPLVVDVLGGRITARGSVDMHPVVADRSEPKVALTLNGDGLEWRGASGAAPAVSGAADLRDICTTNDRQARGTTSTLLVDRLALHSVLVPA